MSTTHTYSVQKEERRRFRHELQRTLEIVRNAKANHIESMICKEANILRQSLTLNERSSDKPFFFDRYRGPLGDTTEPESDETDFYEPQLRLSQNVQGVHDFFLWYLAHHPPEEAPGSVSVSWSKVKCDILFESYFYWESSRIAFPLTNPQSWPHSTKGPNPRLPHVRCLMRNEVVGDDRLLRGELSVITQLMSAQLRTKALLPHLLAPILLFSTMGPWHIRLLEAYYDGTQLVVRNTELIDLRDKDEAVLNNLCRWWYGAGIGDTKVLPRKASA